jgi:hypothetical protein
MHPAASQEMGSCGMARVSVVLVYSARSEGARLGKRRVSARSGWAGENAAWPAVAGGVSTPLERAGK